MLTPPDLPLKPAARTVIAVPTSRFPFDLDPAVLTISGTNECSRRESRGTKHCLAATFLPRSSNNRQELDACFFSALSLP